MYIPLLNVAAFLSVDPRAVSDFVAIGALKPVNGDQARGAELLFEPEDVWAMLPPHLRGKKVTLIAPQAAAKKKKLPMTTLRGWGVAGVITVVELPNETGKYRRQRLVEQEIDQAMRVPTRAVFYTAAELTTLLGLKPAYIQQAVEEGRLKLPRVQPKAGPPRFSSNSVRKFLVGSLYQ